MRVKPQVPYDPSMILFWADSRALLSYSERQEIEQEYCKVVEFGPREILVEHPESKRLVCIRGVWDPTNPPMIPPKAKH